MNYENNILFSKIYCKEILKFNNEITSILKKIKSKVSALLKKKILIKKSLCIEISMPLLFRK